jgi:hypothetical protein
MQSLTFLQHMQRSSARSVSPPCAARRAAAPPRTRGPPEPRPGARAQARWLQTTRAPIRRITFQWRDRAPVAVHGSIDG